MRAIRPRRLTPRTTDSLHAVEPSPNLLLDRRNAPQQLHEVIVGDITNLPLASGRWGYLASWQDQLGKRVVGWAIAEQMTEEFGHPGVGESEQRQQHQERDDHSYRSGETVDSFQTCPGVPSNNPKSFPKSWSSVITYSEAPSHLSVSF